MRLLALVVALLAVNSVHAIDTGAQSHRVIVDAGSTGSRFHIFRYEGDENFLVSSETLGKVKPGLSSFVDSANDDFKGGEAVMKQWNVLMTEAATRLALLTKKPVPLLVRATAGMRALPQEQQERLYESIRAEFEVRYAESFAVKFVLSLGTLTGEQEAWFGFLAANYLSEPAAAAAGGC